MLDNDHYGLEKVKDCIVEYLAVQSRANKPQTGPILCSSGFPASARPARQVDREGVTGREFVARLAWWRAR